MSLCLLAAVGMAHAAPADPTAPIDLAAPIDTAGAGDSGVRVNMILFRGDQAIALVNGRHVRVNEVVAGARVKTIGRNFVELDVNGTTVKHYMAGYANSAGDQ